MNDQKVEEINYVDGFEFMVKDLADMYKLDIEIIKRAPRLPYDTWEVQLKGNGSDQTQIYTVKKVSELTTYDKACSMALNIINDAVRRIFYNSEGCAFYGSVEERFKIQTGH